MDYPGYFEMGKYAVLSSEGAPYVLWFHFLTQLPRVWLSLFPTLI